MTTTSPSPSTPTRTRTTTTGRTRSPFYSAVIGLAALAVLLQGLWAGMFLAHDGQRDAAEGWIQVHATGGEVAIALSAIATVYAFVKMRDRRDLWGGSAALVVLLVLESYLGGLIVDHGKDSLTAVHIPLAMALMGLVVWLPLRATRDR